MAAKTAKGNFVISVTHRIRKEKRGYFALCPEFDVASHGRTVEEADKNLKEAVILYLESIEQLGTRDAIFKKRNIRLERKPKKEIPVELIADEFVTTQLIPCC